jgi:hypothetical protein
MEMNNEVEAFRKLLDFAIFNLKINLKKVDISLYPSELTETADGAITNANWVMTISDRYRRYELILDNIGNGIRYTTHTTTIIDNLVDKLCTIIKWR